MTRRLFRLLCPGLGHHWRPLRERGRTGFACARCGIEMMVSATRPVR